MLESEKRIFKEHLLAAMKDQLLMQLERLKLEIKALQESANEETKSSSGDKYETGRAMAHLEQEKLLQQVADKNQLLGQLSKMKSDVYKSIQTGTVVVTSLGTFFVGVQLGELIIGSKKVTTVSMQSPLGKVLVGAREGSSVVLNTREISVIEFF